jgi:hypothetical protein
VYVSTEVFFGVRVRFAGNFITDGIIFAAPIKLLFKIRKIGKKFSGMDTASKKFKYQKFARYKKKELT